MPLLNYTTKVPVDRTISEITKLLTKQGATKVMSDFEAGESSEKPTAMFDYSTSQKSQTMRYMITIHRLNAYWH